MGRLLFALLISLLFGEVASAQAPSPDTLNVCAGKGYTLSGAGATGASPVAYTWHEGVDGDAMGEIEGTASSLTIAAGMKAPGTYSYVRRAANADCAEGVPSNTFTVVVHALPAAPTVTAVTVCSGLTAALSATVVDSSTPMTYTWTVGTADPATTTGNTYTTSVLTATDPNLITTITYTVQLTNAYGCVATSNVGTITVNPTPVGVSVDPVGPLCSGESTTLFARNWTVGATGTMTMFTWRVGTADPATTTGLWGRIYDTEAPTESTTYTVQLTNSYGCVGAESAPATITVRASPAATVTPREICSGQTVTLSATVVDWGDMAQPVDWEEMARLVQYKWRVGSAETSTNSSSYTTGPLTATTTYTVQIRDLLYGCMGAESAPATITVNALPSSPAVSAVTVCSGLTAALSATVEDSTTPMTYTWRVGTADPATTTGNTYTTSVLTATTVTTTTYTVQIKNANNCVATSNVGTITVRAFPSATVTGREICYDQTAALSVTVNWRGSVPAHVECIWIVGSTVANETMDSNSYTTGALTATTTYAVQVENSSGCSATSNVATITVNALPSSPTVIPRTICYGQTAALLATVVDSSTPMTYTWRVGTAAAKTTTTNSYTTGTLTTNTTYTAQVTNANNCVGAVSAPATITVNPRPPSVTRDPGSGSASQTVLQNTASITVIRYTTSSSVTPIYRTGGNLPSGVISSVTDDGAGSTLTISGTPTSAGAYGYSVASSYTTTGCVSVASTGTITVIPTSSCPQCCWDGSSSTWVNCYVTTNAYPFDNSSPTYVNWMGGSTYYHPNATSDKDGRANTDAITDATGGAVKICKDLGTGWYLPAYEELVNMSAGTVTAYPPLNNLSGADLLTGTGHWSSTEYYNNGGRYSGASSGQPDAVHVNSRDFLSHGAKGGTIRVRCAWRP